MSSHWARVLAEIGAIFAVALLVTWLTRRLILRALRKVRLRQDRAQQRVETLASVLVSFAAVVIWIAALITVLGELNVNIGGVVATATILGGAIAFGAQTIVRDYLAGVFVLTEDQYGVGDIVDLGHATGVVERVTLRSTRLRDNEGRVWHVPNGQVVRVANLSQEWASAVLDVPVRPDADAVHAMQIIGQVARALRDDPVHGAKIMADPEVLGVESVRDDRLLIRLSVRTKPAAQFEVTRLLRLRLLDALRSHDLAIEGLKPPEAGK